MILNNGFVKILHPRIECSIISVQMTLQASSYQNCDFFGFGANQYSIECNTNMFYNTNMSKNLTHLYTLYHALQFCIINAHCNIYNKYALCIINNWDSKSAT